MEKIAFIGGYDKIDMIFYVAKILRTIGKKVLIVDATVPQKSRYIIPTLTPTLTYITTNDSVDFAIGFDTMDKLRAYMAEEGNLEYDYILFDIDSRKKYRGFELMPDDRHYLVTSFDIYSLRKAVEVLKGIEMKTTVAKVYFSKALSDDEDRYLRYLTKDCNVVFKKEPLLFPTDISDMEAIHKNQRDNMIRYKNLSSKYLYGIMYIAEEISGESSGVIKRAIRQIDR
jgi:hypothetical protein